MRFYSTPKTGARSLKVLSYNKLSYIHKSEVVMIKKQI